MQMSGWGCGSAGNAGINTVATVATVLSSKLMPWTYCQALYLLVTPHKGISAPNTTTHDLFSNSPREIIVTLIRRLFLQCLQWKVTMFEVDQFVADCRAAFAEDPTHKAVREVLARAVSKPAAVLTALGEPKRAEVRKLFHSDRLTIINVVWAPMMTVMPHNHNMWAVIGIYSGREDNIFWRRVKGNPSEIEAAGAKSLCVGDAEPLGTDIIHSVLNPIDRLSGAIHIYGGDFFGTERSEWDSLTLLEHRLDVERASRRFEEANARFEATKPTSPG